jgi:hypothetical protein
MELQSEPHFANEKTFFSTAYVCREMGRTVMVMKGTATVMLIDLPSIGTEPQKDNLIMPM